MARRPRAARSQTHWIRWYSALSLASFNRAANRSAAPSGNGLRVRIRHLPRPLSLLLSMIQRKRISIGRDFEDRAAEFGAAAVRHAEEMAQRIAYEFADGSIPAVREIEVVE